MKVGRYQLQLMLLALATGLAWTAAAEKPQSPTAAERDIVVMSADGSRKLGPPATSPGAIPGSELALPDRELPVRPVQPTPDLEACRPPEVTVEVLDPATGRAVVREGSEPPRVVKPGSVLAGSAAVVREIGLDKLVVDVEADGRGAAAVLWIHAAERPGAPARLQCFVPVTSPAPAPGAGTAELPSHP